MASKIPPERVEEVLSRSAGGMGTREIAAWLSKEHGVSVSHVTVARLVQREGAARSSAAKATARATLAKSVRTDAERTEFQLRRAIKIGGQVRGDPDTWVKVSREIREWISLRAKLSGIDQPDAAQAPAAVVLDHETVRRMAAEVLEKT